MTRLEHYERFIGGRGIDRIRKEAEPLVEKHVVHINSTMYGGGVAEIFSTLIPLFNDLGIQTGWRVLKGNNDFFTVTKKFHNALQGDKIRLTPMKKSLYQRMNKQFSTFTHIAAHDCVFVHDPQPLPLIKYFRKTQPWVWRCHIDLSRPNTQLWNYLKPVICKYDRVIMSKRSFMQKLPVPQEIIEPSIDPLSQKNMELSDRKVNKYLRKFNIPQDKPIISQVSRFDKFKDPVGVIEAYKKVKKRVDCRLVLLGSMATDDPEGQQVYGDILDHERGDDDITVINYESDILVNALQRASAVAVQKSLREGFGLTVSEALWKETPVVASNVGGISLQIKHGVNGYLVHSVDSCARAVVKILENPKKAEQMGRRGHEMVKQRFLVTRHLLDYVRLLNRLIIRYKT